MKQSLRRKNWQCAENNPISKYDLSNMKMKVKLNCHEIKKKSSSLNQRFVVHKDRIKLFSSRKCSLLLKEKAISSKADNTTRSKVTIVLIHDDNIDLVNEIPNFLFLSCYKFYSYSETASEFHSLSDCNL